MVARKTFALATIFLFAADSSFAEVPYLDDANPPAALSGSSVASTSPDLFPRVYFHEASGDVTPEQISKYPLIVSHATGFGRIGKALSDFSSDAVVMRHLSGRAYQGFAYKDCYVTAGIAFESTGPVSHGGPRAKGCDMFAGHWLYRAGAKLTQSVGANALTLPVTDASRFTPGQYVVIYDAPAGSFNNSEHAKVTGRNLANDTVTLQSRGFKSTPKSHAAGAIVAQHVTGQGPENELWAFNLTSQSPRDGAGRTFAQFYAGWLDANLGRYNDGVQARFDIAGILFDADMYVELPSNQVDANNDLVRDDAWSASGVNWLGQGLDQFYALLRNRMPDKYILTGVHEARGFTSTNGTEMENWLDFGNGDFRAVPQYKHLNSMFSTYLFNMVEGYSPPLVQNLSKSPTRLYPYKTNPPPANNRAARLGLALTLMDNGYFGTHSRIEPDAWWDEYAVNVTPGSPVYGEAISKHSTAAARQHSGWLGQPLGPFERVYDDASFAASKSIVDNGLFESGVGGWSASRVKISRITSAMDGIGALRASAMTSYSDSINGAHVKSPRIDLAAGQQYTIAFSARASKPRQIRVALGNFADRFMVGTDWRRYVISFQQTKSQSRPLFFYVGRENTSVDFDSVYVFRGNVNVFRRDFQNGIAVANATPVTRTIPLGGTFRKIKGAQDPAINDGRSVTSVTLPPYDALLLVRPEGSVGDTKPSPGTGSGTIGNYVWLDTDGDGIQDSDESGLGGVTVRLQDCKTGTSRATTSRSTGSYGFTDIAAGRYRVVFVAPDGMSFSPAGRGSNGGKDSNPSPLTGETPCLSMNDGRTRNWVDAGLHR